MLIGFGCSFAVCDESDQALASFRAAQNKYSGSHVPLLYMGMEYLRTNHLSLAGHFLNSAQKTDPCDLLCCNELGVWSYRQGNMKDAAFWFMKALRLHIRTEGSALNSTDEGLGMNGYTLLTGQVEQRVGAPNQGAVAEGASTPYVKRGSKSNEPPLSTILCAAKTPSGQSIAASIFGENNVDDSAGLTDSECIERCKDKFWEPTIFNLGQSYRKMKGYSTAIVCFEKCVSLNPVSCIEVVLQKDLYVLFYSLLIPYTILLYLPHYRVTMQLTQPWAFPNILMVMWMVPLIPIMRH